MFSCCCKKYTRSVTYTEDLPQYFVTINIPSEPEHCLMINPQYEYLSNITYKTSIPYIPNITHGKVVKVYDGDTITIATRIPNDSTIYRFSIRLLGIDCPEMKTHNSTEKELAIKARDALSNMIMYKIVQLKNISIEKYGRILANVYFQDINLSEWMISHGYAVLYDGKTKQIPEAWISVNEVKCDR